MKYLLCILSFCVLFSCVSIRPTADFSDTIKEEPLPDYSSLKMWVAHPQKKDESDRYPKNLIEPLPEKASEIDVFFVYPTLYLAGPNWNADVNNKGLNREIEHTTIRHQASVFNGLANIYSPLYRQMHIYGYSDSLNGSKAIRLAYGDVEAAFEYYWKNWNKGKRFVIASHSQGTNHAELLLKEYILKNEEMTEKLELAYLVGMPIEAFSEKLPPCSSPKELDCFLSWRTFSDGHIPSYRYGDDIASVNPITWKSDSDSSSYDAHKGILFKNRKIRFSGYASARVHKGLLWVKFKKLPFEKLYQKDNYHIADYNIFWLNIRENFRERFP